MERELSVYEGDTTPWQFTLSDPDIAINLTNATAVLRVPHLDIQLDGKVDPENGVANFTPEASDTTGKDCYREKGFIVVTFAGGEEATFPFRLTINPRSTWSLLTPTTSTSSSTTTSSSTSSSTSTTTTTSSSTSTSSSTTTSSSTSTSTTTT